MAATTKTTTQVNGNTVTQKRTIEVNQRNVQSARQNYGNSTQ